MTVYQVDVVFTDRQRDAEGRYVEYRSRVSVRAESPLDAEWVGTAMVIGHPAREALDVMPLRSALVE